MKSGKNIIKRMLLYLFMKAFNIKGLDIKQIRLDEYNTDLILSCIHKNGFVALNKRGEYFMKGFTLIEIVRDKITVDKKTSSVISEIRIKHDIDAGAPIKYTIIWNKFTDLQYYMDYFNRI